MRQKQTGQPEGGGQAASSAGLAPVLGRVETNLRRGLMLRVSLLGHLDPYLDPYLQPPVIKPR